MNIPIQRQDYLDKEIFEIISLVEVTDFLAIKKVDYVSFNEDENIIVSTGFLVLRPKNNTDNKYLFHLLRSSIFQNEKICVPFFANYYGLGYGD